MNDPQPAAPVAKQFWTTAAAAAELGRSVNEILHIVQQYGVRRIQVGTGKVFTPETMQALRDAAVQYDAQRAASADVTALPAQPSRGGRAKQAATAS